MLGYLLGCKHICPNSINPLAAIDGILRHFDFCTKRKPLGVEDRLLPHFFWSLGHFENLLKKVAGFRTPPHQTEQLGGFQKGVVPPFARGIEGGSGPSPSKIFQN